MAYWPYFKIFKNYVYFVCFAMKLCMYTVLPVFGTKLLQVCIQLSIHIECVQSINKIQISDRFAEIYKSKFMKP